MWPQPPLWIGIKDPATTTAPSCTPCTHLFVWPGPAPTPLSSLQMMVMVLGLFSGNDEKAYLEEVANPSLWCQDNSLMLNVSKTKELIMDFRGLAHHWGLMGLLWRG